MLLGKLFKTATIHNSKIPIDGIAFDSRKVKKNYIFFAIEGNKKSGTKYIEEALLKGASAIVTDKNFKYNNFQAPFIKVNDVRKSLSEACSNLYRVKPQNIIAVTGTNGKSSVADFFYQILSLHKVRAASIGTLGIVSKNYKKKMNLTSTDPLMLHKNLEILKKKKINNVILEASSHGLEQKRLDNLNIKTGIFTNLSHDHLDYHHTMESYFNSKLYLFKNLLNKKSNIITDEENKEFNVIKKIAKKRKIKIVTIGKNSKNIKILENKYNENNQIIKILVNSKIYNLEIPLIGYFQIKNLLMAVFAAFNCGLSKNKILNNINKIKPVPGRLECICYLKNNSKIIIDFAHTPAALEKSLIALTIQFKKKILLVFGCGGERDKKKRFIMGKIASKYCRKVFVTDDNPRNENPSKIRKQIIRGCKKNSVNIANRKKAIKNAIKELGSNEILLVAGKGHETTQDYGNKILDFSDKKIIKEIIRKSKSYMKKNNYYESLLKKNFDNSSLNKVKFNGVSINTKTLKKNELFFSIKGKNTDGHKFLRQAIKKGAIRCIISKQIKKIPKSKIIKVNNTLSSLSNLAKITRDSSSARIIGITGSVGKTTVKNLVSFILKNYGNVYHSPHSYNNKFGVPLSVANLKKNTDYGVFEIGMDKKGEIYNLSKIVKPEIAIITNISGAHFKNFNSLKDIAKAKSEIIENIVNGGTLILNKDDKFFNFFLNKAQKKGIKVVTFGLKKRADIFLSKIKKNNSNYKLKIIIKKRVYYFYTKNATSSFIMNILASISVLRILNLNLKKIKKKLFNFQIPSGRGDVKIIKNFKKNFKLIDESYNANPLSMLSAIKNMNYYKVKRNSKKIVFLGDMLELGKKSKKFHKELSKVINKSDINKVFVYGNYIKETFKLLKKNKKGKVFNNFGEAYKYFKKNINNNDLLMIKGSNATGLNKFSKSIKGGQINVI